MWKEKRVEDRQLTTDSFIQVILCWFRLRNSIFRDGCVGRWEGEAREERKGERGGGREERGRQGGEERGERGRQGGEERGERGRHGGEERGRQGGEERGRHGGERREGREKGKGKAGRRERGT